MVPRKEPTLQKSAAVGDGIMAQPNTNRDYDDTDARHPNDTPGGMQGNAHDANETTEATGTTKPSHPRTANPGAGKGKRQKKNPMLKE